MVGMRSRGIGRAGLTLLTVLVAVSGAAGARAALSSSGGPIAQPPTVSLLQPGTLTPTRRAVHGQRQRHLSLIGAAGRARVGRLGP